ncbi:MAG: single-stranded DNA-binding protein [Tepidisphaeraceae bacterium]
MANYNKVILVGNLTRDPQLKYLPSQMAVVEFGLAVNHKYKTKNGEDREEVLFVDVSAFGKQAEIINQYCQKGRPLLVEGRLKYDTWEDKQGGGKRSKHSVVIDNFQLLGGRDSGGGGGGGGGGGAGAGGGGYDESAPPRRSGPPQQNRGPQQQRPQQEPPFSEEQQFKDDDIPF